MKKYVFAVVLTALLAAVGFSQTVAKDVPVTQEGREVFATLTRWADAVRDRDTTALERLFAEELIITTYDGQVRGKAEELEALKPNPNRTTVSIVNEDVKVTFYGTSAVVTALMKIHSRADERDVRSAFRYTAVLINREGRWQIAALQSIRAPEAKSR